MAITLQKKEDKDQADGYAGLDGAGLLKVAEIPALNLLPAPAADVSLNSQKITNLADPGADGDAANKDYVDDALDTAKAYADLAQPARTVTQQADNYGLLLVDANTTIEATKATAMAINIPLNATQAFPVNTVIDIVAVGAGVVTVTITATGTLQSLGGKVAISGQFGVVRLRKRATDTWLLTGNLV